MQKKRTLFILAIFCAISLSSFAQNIEVQTLTYESTTRDTMVTFPDVDHNDYEKILMYYSMRCKDGLVSQGVAGQTNIGCGEWDYSCNTSLIDSTRTDSLYAVSPSHLISRFTGEVFDYTTVPTYSYYQKPQYATVYGGIVSETETTVGTGMEADALPLGDNKTVARSQFLYKAAALANGLEAGMLTGLKMNIDANAAGYEDLRIRLKATTKESLSASELGETGFQEVYFLDTDFEAGTHFFPFYENFDWDGSSNIIIDFSYKNKAGATAVIHSSTQADVSSLHINASTDYNAEVLGSGHATVEQPFDEISNEITISMWNYGDASMPLNSTIFEGRDADNRRQANAHLPWSNGQVYWDCGNDGSYDRINKTADANTFKNKWNHWAFTKNATTGSMKIYLNGSLWHTGADKFKPIDIQAFRVGGAITWENPYYGKIDEFRVWNKELSASEILAWKDKSITTSHPSYDNLVAYYKLDDANSTTLTDASPYERHGVMTGPVVYRQRTAANLNTNITESVNLPNMTFVQGEYTDVSIDIVPKIDSLINIPNQVQEYVLEGTDLVLDNTETFYASGAMPVYNQSGQLVDSVLVQTENSIAISELEHYTKAPSKIEIMSFVTPYGINLDMGIEGETWVFDVTDFGPILKGSKRLIMDRGGQWQEDMDIRFVYVEGTPSRDVLDMRQVWRPTSENYQRINDDFRFEPVQMPLDANASAYKLKAAITGHGQEGEFIPRNHHFNINGGAKEMEWSVWKECAANPVYPQGGTWIYDRAGWCPGMATDVQELDFTPFVTPGETAEIDYGMDVASGDSRYIVNIQMVTYGAPNFSQDAELLEIISPSNKIEYDRLNPVCGKPKIVIRNNGSTPLTSLEIAYDINGNNETYYTWTGNLGYLETEEVDLPEMNASLMAQENASLNISVGNPNNGLDEYANNNSKSTNFDVVEQHGNGIVIRLRTNSAAIETSWRLYDVNNELVKSRIFGLNANTTYIDTIQDLSGCYRLVVQDSDDDGISFWANNDGSGSVAVSNFTSLPVNFFDAIATDFGKFIVYEFIAGDVTPTREFANNRLLEVFPNPSAGDFQLNLGGFEGAVQIRVLNQLGQVLHQFEVEDAYFERQEQLDLADFKDGIYYLEVIENQQRLIRKLVKAGF